MTAYPLLDALEFPGGVQKLPAAELSRLADELRARIVEVVGQNGGHLSSNLGVVELTIALHRVFSFERDRLLFDVGHQSYAHKLLTGRHKNFPTLRKLDGITGFPNPWESPADPFRVGHASTALGSALGFATAFTRTGRPDKAVALVGDAAIVGGLAFEALNHAGQTKADVLLILNDNDMAISKTVGALSTHLTALRTNPATRKARAASRRLLRRIPLVGEPLERFQEWMLSGVRGLSEPVHVFSALGFEYFGPISGNDIFALERELSRLRDMPGPRVLHVATEKGHGLAAAAADPETFHSPPPFEVKGRGETAFRKREEVSYTELFSRRLIERAEKDPRVVAITAAMPSGTGIREFGRNHPERFYDVGICEAHSVVFAAALAAGGLKPVLAIYSTFLQRAYDQLIHDLAAQPELPVVLALDRAGLVGADGPTHHGVFDIAFLRHIPGMTLMAPRDGAELSAMLDLALTLSGPSAIRYPRGTPPDSSPTVKDWPALSPLSLGKSETLTTGKDGAILAYGRMVEPALAAARELAGDGIGLTVVNARFAKPLDREMILDVAAKHPWLATVEDHVLAGGFGSAVAECLVDAGVMARVHRFGVPDRFVEQGSVSELDARLGLDAQGLAKALRALHQKSIKK